MQNGSVVRRTRKMHSDIWQFRWREKTADGKKIYRRRQIGTIDQIPDIEAARKIAGLLVPDLNARLEKSKSSSMTIAQLCSILSNANCVSRILGEATQPRISTRSI